MKKRIQLVHFDRRPQDKKKAEKRNKKKTKKEKKDIYMCTYMHTYMYTHAAVGRLTLLRKREKYEQKKQEKRCRRW